MTNQMLLERTQETMRIATTERAGGRPLVNMSSPSPTAKAALAPPAPTACSFCPDIASVASPLRLGALVHLFCGYHAAELLGTLPAEMLSALERESR